MADDFRILFADDEETFLDSTCELLRRAGYACDSALDGDSARNLLQQQRYDLVIADLKMPGNHELEFARQITRLSDSLSIILVTGHPSLSSAIEALDLRVVAYLIKPFAFSELMAKVRATAERTRFRRLVEQEIARSKDYRQDLLAVLQSLDDGPRAAPTQSLQALVGLTLRTVVERLANLHGLVRQTEESAGENAQLSAAMPRDLEQALQDAVATLERTKSAFKSKELGELRKRLEILLRN
jgi:DNA-binding response OmpR family regulator